MLTLNNHRKRDLNELALFFRLKERDFGAIGSVIMSACENDKEVFVLIKQY